MGIMRYASVSAVRRRPGETEEGEGHRENPGPPGEQSLATQGGSMRCGRRRFLAGNRRFYADGFSRAENALNEKIEEIRSGRALNKLEDELKELKKKRAELKKRGWKPE